MADHDAARSRDERLRRMAAVGFLIRSFAHEFNNLLGTVLGSAHLLALQSGDPAQRARLTALVDASRQAIALSQSLSGLARDPHEGVRRALDLHALLSELPVTMGATGIALALELKAGACHAAGEVGTLGDALATVVEAVAGGSGAATIATVNRSRIASKPAGDGDSGAAGSAWLRLAVTAGAPPVGEALRRLLQQPLSARPEDTGEVVLAGAIAVIGQARGRLLIPEGTAAAELHVYLPTVTATPE
jgi:signal transduction histidine kinase